MKHRPTVRTTDRTKNGRTRASTKSASGSRRETVPIISSSETSLAMTREAAKTLLLSETESGGKLYGMCLVPDATLATMEGLLALVGREEEIKKIRFQNMADYGVEIRHLRPQKHQTRNSGRPERVRSN